MKKMLSDFPQLMSEWDYNANTRDPNTISYGSTYVANWICSSCGNHFQMEVRARTKGRNCQKCKTSPKTSFMEQAILYYTEKFFGNVKNRYRGLFPNNMELDVYLPDLFVGIEFDGAYFHQRSSQIIRDRNKYRYCKEKGITLIRITEDERKPFGCESDYHISMEGKRDLKTQNRVLCNLLFLLFKREADFDVYHFEGITKKMEEIESLINIDRDRFEILASCRRARYEDSLERRYPEIAKEWDYEKNYPLTPSMVTPGSNEKVFWKCHKCKNSYKAAVYERTGRDRTSCPICSIKESAEKRKQTLLLAKGSLADTHKHLLAKWNYEKNTVKPTEIVAGSHDMVFWKCDECGYDDWIDSPHHMSVRNSKCPCCLNRVLVKGINDLQTKRPDLVLDWDYERNTIKPDEVVAGGVTIVNWKCHICGNRWRTTLSARINGNGCRKCASLKQSERQGKQIVQYSEDGDFIQEWNSIDEASRALKINRSSISNALRKPNKTAGKYKWKYK